MCLDTQGTILLRRSSSYKVGGRVTAEAGIRYEVNYELARSD